MDLTLVNMFARSVQLFGGRTAFLSEDRSYYELVVDRDWNDVTHEYPSGLELEDIEED